MIAREELQMLVAGAVNEAGRAVEQATGRKLTRSELEELYGVMSTFGRLVADRCQSATKLPPPPPFRERRHGQFFDPLKTQELRAVSDADIQRMVDAKAKK